VPVVARLRVHGLEDLVGRVEADEVEQRQRAHRVPVPERIAASMSSREA
jgi:hypothetical protein